MSVNPHGALPLDATVASPGRRLAARLLDGLIVGLPLSIVAFILFSSSPGDVDDLNQLQRDLQGAGLVVTMLVLLYEAVFIRSYGATFGKMIMRIRVVVEHSGHLPEWGPSFLRVAIPTAAGFIPGVGGLATMVVYLSLLFDPLRQSWYDKAAKTVVINHVSHRYEPSGMRPESPIR